MIRNLKITHSKSPMKKRSPKYPPNKPKIAPPLKRIVPRKISQKSVPYVLDDLNPPLVCNLFWIV